MRSYDFSKGASNQILISEAVAKLISEDSINSRQFLEHMAKYNTDFAYKLLYKIQGISEILGESSQSERITRELTKALSKQSEVYFEDETKYSKHKTKSGYPFVLSDDKLGKSPSIKEVSKYADTLIKNLLIENENTNDKMGFSEKDKNKVINFISKNHNKQGRVVARIFGNYDELIEVGTFLNSGQPTPEKGYGTNGWDI